MDASLKSEAKSPKSSTESAKSDGSYMLSCFAKYMVYLSFYPEVSKLNAKATKPKSMNILEQYLGKGMKEYNIKLSPAEFEKFTNLSFMLLKMISEGYVTVPGATAKDYQEFKTWLDGTQPVKTPSKSAPSFVPQVMRTGGLPTAAASPAASLVSPMRGGMPRGRRGRGASPPPPPPSGSGDEIVTYSPSSPSGPLVVFYGDERGEAPSILGYLFDSLLLFLIMFCAYLGWGAIDATLNITNTIWEIVMRELHAGGLAPDPSTLAGLTPGQMQQVVNSVVPRLGEHGIPAIPVDTPRLPLWDFLSNLFNTLTTGDIRWFTEAVEQIQEGTIDYLSQLSEEITLQLITMIRANAQGAAEPLEGILRAAVSPRDVYGAARTAVTAKTTAVGAISRAALEANYALRRTNAAIVYALQGIAERHQVVVQRIALDIGISVTSTMEMLVYTGRAIAGLVPLFAARMAWRSRRRQASRASPLRITSGTGDEDQPGHRDDEDEPHWHKFAPPRGGRRRRSSKRRSARKTQKHRRRKSTKKSKRRKRSKRSKRTKRSKRSKRSKR